MIVCGSTTEGEEELVLAAFQEVLQRFPSSGDGAGSTTSGALRQSRGAGGEFRIENGEAKRVVFEIFARICAGSSTRTGVVFCSTPSASWRLFTNWRRWHLWAEAWYRLDGHNILEPAQHGVAILTGPHTFNFREIVRIFAEGGGLKTSVRGKSGRSS